MEQSDGHDRILDVMEKNAELLQENNKLLKKLYRQNIIALAIRVFWYVIIIGLPFAVYFYVLEPYFQAFGANYETFRTGMGEIPGLKALEFLSQ